MRDYKKHKLKFSPYLEKLYQSDKPMIIYKFGNKYKVFTDFSKKIILINSNINGFLNSFSNKKYKVKFNPYLDKLYNSDKRLIIYKIANGYNIY